MTRYAIVRKDGYYLAHYGYAQSVKNALTYDSMTEAELKILSNGLSECVVVPVEAK